MKRPAAPSKGAGFTRSSRSIGRRDRRIDGESDVEFSGRVELRFGREAIDLRRLEVGQQVWKTDDPELTRRLRRSFEGPPRRKVGLDLDVVAVAGEPLAHRRDRRPTGVRASVQSADALGMAESRAADLELFQTQLGRLGGTIYQLARLEATIEGRPMVPMSLLNQLRRELVARLDEAAAALPARTIAPQPVLPRLLEPILAERDRQRRTAQSQPVPVELRFSVGAPTRSKRPWSSASPRSTPSIRTSSNIAEAVAAVRRADGRRRSTWRPRASRSPARPTSSAFWPSKGPTASWSATRGA